VLSAASHEGSAAEKKLAMKAMKGTARRASALVYKENLSYYLY